MNGLLLDAFILETEIALTNALNNALILAEMSRYNMGADKIEPMVVLLGQVKHLISQQKGAYGAQFQATQSCRQLWAVARAAYMRDLALARVVFAGNVEAWGGLLLGSGRQQSLAGAVEQARVFYENLLGKPALLAAMVAHGRSQLALSQNQAQLTAVLSAKSHQLALRGEAQQATQARATAVKELAAFMKKFRQIARLALAEHPQWREQLGMVAKRKKG